MTTQPVDKNPTPDETNLTIETLKALVDEQFSADVTIVEKGRSWEIRQTVGGVSVIYGRYVPKRGRLIVTDARQQPASWRKGDPYAEDWKYDNGSWTKAK